jgi:hypothetical protein
MEHVVGIIALLVIFGSFFGIMYMYYTTRNRERMALIEKNADPSIFKTESPGTLKAASIKLGLLLAGAGIGVLMGNILEITTSLSEDSAYFSMILLFSGAGLFLSYFISRKLTK